MSSNILSPRTFDNAFNDGEYRFDPEGTPGGNFQLNDGSVISEMVEIKRGHWQEFIEACDSARRSGTRVNHETDRIYHPY